MLTRKLTHLEAHAIAHRLRQAGEVVAGVVEELMGMDPSRECGEQDCPHGVDDGACKQCYGEATSGEQGAANDQNSAKHRYFVYDPEGNGFDLYDTDAQREAAHLAAIAEARQAAMDDGEWALDVERIVSGFVTHTTVAAEMDGGGCDYAPLSAFTASAPTLGEAIYQHDQGDGFWKDVPYAEWQLLGAKWRRIVYTAPAAPQLQAAEPKGMTDEERKQIDNALDMLLCDMRAANWEGDAAYSAGEKARALLRKGY